jgi:protein phosphatase
MTLRLQAAGVSDAGSGRLVNQDAFCADPGLGLVAVADGMGGRAAGEVASRLAIEALRSHLEAQPDRKAGPPSLAALEAAAQAGNERILRAAARDARLQGMGTTLTAAWVCDRAANIVHVGDSRAYLHRQGHISQLTTDHTLDGLRRSQGAGAPDGRAEAGVRKLLSALGQLPRVGVDLVLVELKAGDLLILCTDGLSAHLTDEDLASKGSLPLPLAERAATMAKLAVERGSVDDVTVVLAAMTEHSTVAER